MQNEKYKKQTTEINLIFNSADFIECKVIKKAEETIITISYFDDEIVTEPFKKIPVNTYKGVAHGEKA